MDKLIIQNDLLASIETERQKRKSVDRSAEVPEFRISEYLFKNLERSAYISYYRQIPNSGIKLIAKRIIQKCVKFCIAPSLQDISSYNYQVYSTLKNMQLELDECNLEIKQLKRDLNLYRKK